MTTAFKMIAHRNSDNLHLRLIGDFDGAAAVQLAHYLGREYFDFQRIYIHTCCLSSLEPFASRLFLKKCIAAGIIMNGLVFTGEFKDQLAPGQAEDMAGVFPDIPKTPVQASYDEYSINLSATPKNNLCAYGRVGAL